MTTSTSVHAFTDDALGEHDATALAELIGAGALSVHETTQAAIARAQRMQPLLNGVHYPAYEAALEATLEAAPERSDRARCGLLFGVPTYVKDNVDVVGLPTNHGTAAFSARPAEKDSPFVAQFRSLGLVVLGKSRLPEFGFSASTEYAAADPVRNPWDLDYSAGASSGGSAALVASGVVPIAHANDGGGSIRIPAAACGLVGLKPTRGRLVADPVESRMPVRIVSQGVLTRSVRDTARFFAGAEDYWRNPRLAPVRHVRGPNPTRLRVGMVIDSVGGQATDPETRQAVLHTARLLEALGHRVEETTVPVTEQFAEDFARYWALLGLLITASGRLLGPDFDAGRTENLTKGLARRCRRELASMPGVLVRLRRVTRQYRRAFRQHDVLLTPVLSHTTPRLGHLAATLDFDELFGRLQAYVGFTPLNNAAGGPAMSLPLAQTRRGLPIGVQLAADVGDDRTLLELAYELEEANPFPRITAAPRISAPSLRGLSDQHLGSP